jgi:peptide/nickel transport system permease protein
MSELPLQLPKAPGRNLYLALGAALTGVALATALVGMAYHPYGPAQIDLLHRLAPPSAEHLMGTDRFGRDVLSRVLAGGWRSMALGLGATALALAIGVPIALATGFYRGRIDQTMMRFVDALLSIPTLVFALIIIVALGPGQLQAILALGVAASPKFVRVVRSVVIEAAGQDYVKAAKARGEDALYIQYSEILPNVWAPVIVEASINAGFALMGGAALSYLGLGTQPPFADWGVMINEAQRYISVSYWPLLGPALAICVSIVGFNLFGEGLRDHLHIRASLRDV